jgi:hypothetical protein
MPPVLKPLPGQAVLVLRAGEGTLLLRIGTAGIEPWPAEVPGVWVTAPLDTPGAGLALSGPFAVDVGRAQLFASSPDNDALADRIAGTLGQRLLELWGISESGWQSFRESLGLGPAVDPYSFWESLWGVLAGAFRRRTTEEENPAAGLLRCVLWGHPERGARRLFGCEAALPSELPPGSYRRLTSVEQVRWFTAGWMNRPGIFPAVSAWPSFRQHIPEGAILSGPRWQEVRLLLDPAGTVEPLTLTRAVGWELGRVVEPEQAIRLGQLIGPPFRRELEQPPVGEEELPGLLRGVLFQACDGNWYRPGELLLGGEISPDTEERRRAAFAPDERLLAESYTVPQPDGARPGVAFFLACREQIPGDAEEVNRWITRASGDRRQAAALAYLNGGSLARAILDRLPRQVGGSWLESLSDQEMQRLGVSDLLARLILLGRLGRVDLSRALEPPPELLPPPSQRTLPARETLERIHRWWERERSRWVRWYEEAVYPGGQVPTLALEDPGDDRDQRRGWLTLFVLGMTHTMGRQTVQQHRGFLEHHARLFNELAAPAPDLDGCLAVLDDHLERSQEEIEYFHWWRYLFVGAWIMASRLGSYVEAFRVAQLSRSPFDLTDVTRTRSSRVHQGGGISAPPISRVLGQGACFVMRELVRKKLVVNQQAWEHCYVPSLGVRRLLTRLSFTEDRGSRPWEVSRDIHGFLVEHLTDERVRFGGDFDIPFQVLALNTDVAERVLAGEMPPEPPRN